MYSFEVSKSTISASEPQKMMVLWRFETMTLLMRHPVFNCQLKGFFSMGLQSRAEICLKFNKKIKIQAVVNHCLSTDGYQPTKTK